MLPVLLPLIQLERICQGRKLVKINCYKRSARPVIFAATHVGGGYDIQICFEFLQEHAILLSGSQREHYGTLNGFMLQLALVTYVDRADKEDRAVSKQTMIRHLQNGANILWFPEGVWNVSPNLPVLPMSYGVIEVAQAAGCSIVPVGLEYYGNTFYCKVGDVFDPTQYPNKKAGIGALRDVLATLKWDIWADYGKASRDSLKAEDWEEFTAKLVSEWKWTDYTREKQFIYRDRTLTTREEAFAHLDDIVVRPQTAFLLRGRS